MFNTHDTSQGIVSIQSNVTVNMRITYPQGVQSEVLEALNAGRFTVTLSGPDPMIGGVRFVHASRAIGHDDSAPKTIIEAVCARIRELTK